MEISPDDFVIEDCTRGGYNLGSQDYGFLGNFTEMDNALIAFKGWCKENNYFPSLYFMSDHGNLTPIDYDGNEIKTD